MLRPINYGILVLITYELNSLFNSQADVSCGARGLKFGFNLHPTQYGPRPQKPCLWDYEQPRYRPACTSAQSDQRLIIHILEIIISKIATSEI